MAEASGFGLNIKCESKQTIHLNEISNQIAEFSHRKHRNRRETIDCARFWQLSAVIYRNLPSVTISVCAFFRYLSFFDYFPQFLVWTSFSSRLYRNVLVLLSSWWPNASRLTTALPVFLLHESRQSYICMSCPDLVAN